MIQNCPLLTLQNAEKNFQDQRVFSNVFFECYAHHITGISGASGCGKTTLLRCMVGLSALSSGNRLWKGRVITPQNASLFKKSIGFVPQHSALFPHKTVLENILYAPLLRRGSDKKTLIARAEEWLSTMGLSAYIDCFPKTLSGGQQQRIAIIRAAILSPDLLFFDEPTSALDKESATIVTSIMKKLAREGMGLVIVTHDLELAQSVCSTFWLLENGHLVRRTFAQ